MALMVEYSRVELLAALKLVGKSQSMSFQVDQTFKLWRSFMPERAAIRHAIGGELFSVEQYPTGYFDAFDPARPFLKWAAVAVTDFEQLSPGMEPLTIPPGLYAVFIHHGPASEGPRTYTYIFREWLPASGYQLDDRPHFALMGEDYRNDSPESKEEIWIPVMKKA